ncbi:MAG: putative transcriptional regulator [Rhodothermales bacterium]|jgi:putative transcriptional regulator
MLPKNDIEPAPGVLLIAGTALQDSYFGRAVVLLCEHQDEGSFGLVLNHAMPISLDDVVNELSWTAPLCCGGPVAENTLHFLHPHANLGIGSREVLPGIYWGGDFDALREKVMLGQVKPEDLRFFLGYSGWSAGQLASEISEDSWFMTPANAENVFYEDSANHWRHAFTGMGPAFAILGNFPDDPRLN